MGTVSRRMRDLSPFLIAENLKHRSPSVPKGTVESGALLSDGKPMFITSGSALRKSHGG